MKPILLVLVYFILINGDNNIVNEANIKTLRLVHAVWRHGDRTPSSVLPNDPNNDINSWVIGLGELTKVGAQQEFNLGKLIRKRYNTFISDEYSPFEIYVRSSDYNRTLASGQAVMAGLYSVDGKVNLNPVPIHTVPKLIDNLMYDRIICPAADDERFRVYHSDPSVVKIATENANILKYLGEHSGIETVPFNLRQMWFIYDPLNAIVSHPETHSLPSWVNETIKDQIWKLYDKSSSFMFHSHLLKRLRGGPIFDDLIKRMLMRKDGSLDSRFRFYGYSGHDTTIGALLGAFGITLEKFPKYSTALFIELHYEKNEYIVRLFYKNETDSSSIIPLNIPECSPDCSLDRLIELRREFIPLDWESECGLKKWYNINESICLFFVIISIILISTIIITLLFKHVKCQNTISQQRRVNELELKVDVDRSESGIHLLSDSDDSEF